MNGRRRIAYITGTRADFGLMESTLQRIAADSEMHLDILVTGMHLLTEHGSTIRDIEASGLHISGVVPIVSGRATGVLMAQNIGRILQGLTGELDRLRPDLVLLLGDRGEMLAGAIAALHLNIPVAHIHGGERSGTVDEPIRHAISKLSHLHFVATEESRDRLVRMGEHPASIHVTGAPGLDGLQNLARHDRTALFASHGLNPDRRTALLLHHPVVQEAMKSSNRTAAILSALQELDLQVLAFMPNSDAGGTEIANLVQERSATSDNWRFITHLPRAAFASFLRETDVLVGNSSSGIIEAASFGTPVVNIGSRQNLRERNANVIDTPGETAKQIVTAITAALKIGRMPTVNIYGDGHAGERIAHLVRTVQLEGLGAKANAY
jgi:GDP/UDP-N,N'-diacetylbacillosamine 2-epimerase (hydrolysing)